MRHTNLRTQESMWHTASHTVKVCWIKEHGQYQFPRYSIQVLPKEAAVWDGQQ